MSDKSEQLDDMFDLDTETETEDDFDTEYEVENEDIFNEYHKEKEKEKQERSKPADPLEIFDVEETPIGRNIKTPSTVDAPLEHQPSVAAKSRTVGSSQPQPEPSRNVDPELVASMERSEELEEVLVKQNGRYIPNIDNVKIGKTIYGEDNVNQNLQAPTNIFVEQVHPSYYSAGVNTTKDGNPVLDTGDGAQTEDDIPQRELRANDVTDPLF